MVYIPVPLSTCISCFSQLLTSFGPKEDVKGGYRKWRVVICNLYQILSGWSNPQKWHGKGMQLIWQIQKIHIKFSLRTSGKYDLSTACSTYGKCKKMNIKISTSEWRVSLRRHKHSWVDNTEMYLKVTA